MNLKLLENIKFVKSWAIFNQPVFVSKTKSVQQKYAHSLL